MVFAMRCRMYDSTACEEEPQKKKRIGEGGRERGGRRKGGKEEREGKQCGLRQLATATTSTCTSRNCLSAGDAYAARVLGYCCLAQGGQHLLLSALLSLVHLLPVWNGEGPLDFGFPAWKEGGG